MTVFVTNVFRMAHDENTAANVKLQTMGQFQDRAIELYLASLRREFLQACITTCEHWLSETYPKLIQQTEQEIQELDTRVSVLQANLEKTKKRKIGSLDEADQLREDIAELEREVNSAELSLVGAQQYLDATLPGLLAEREQDLQIYHGRLRDEPPILGGNGNGHMG